MEEQLIFEKYSGAGNDFIMLNNFKSAKNMEYSSMTKVLCKRGLAVGADGLIAIENSNKADFKMKYFNSDGSEAQMCGNGGRCISMFAYKAGIVGKKMTFETLSGIYSSEIIGDDVRLKMIPPKNYLEYILAYDSNGYKGYLIDTGVPHFVIFYYPKGDIKKIGGFFRYHKNFQPEGTNVDFVKVVDKNNIEIRTYERGVENETLACGTGSAASALIAVLMGKCEGSVNVLTKSGIFLKIDSNIENGEVKEYFLEGNAEKVYEGKLSRSFSDKI
ncbi:diaminopimelate epimerase [bacterium]|nr:diaminopimelate epimerase [bacterium]